MIKKQNKEKNEIHPMKEWLVEPPLAAMILSNCGELLSRIVVE